MWKDNVVVYLGRYANTSLQENHENFSRDSRAPDRDMNPIFTKLGKVRRKKTTWKTKA
jgi:hypothetical protein